VSGYTPLFSSLTTGTLCGRWPDIGLWPIVLSMADRHGVVDCTAAYISGVTGLPVDEVTACMKRFCQPDPGSRSNVEAGARLVLLEEHREWGWRVVNHGLYREKARLEAKNAREVSSGKNAERMGHRKPPETAADRREPPLTDPSYSNANSYSNKEQEKRARPKRASRVPEDFVPDLEFARSQLSGVDAEREAQKFRDWEFKTPRSDWAAAWRNWIGRCRETGSYAKKNGGPSEWL